MPNMANITIAGHVTRDPEANDTKSGTVVRFGIAVNGPRDNDLTAFFNCSIWGKRGDVIRQYVGKGDPLLVTGSFKVSEYESNGQKRQGLEVNVNDFTFLKSRKDDGGARPTSAASGNYQPVTDSEIPF